MSIKWKLYVVLFPFSSLIIISRNTVFILCQRHEYHSSIGGCCARNYSDEESKILRSKENSSFTVLYIVADCEPQMEPVFGSASSAVHLLSHLMFEATFDHISFCLVKFFNLILHSTIMMKFCFPPVFITSLNLKNLTDENVFCLEISSARNSGKELTY